MDPSMMIQQLLAFILAVVVLAGVPLAVATGVGLVISFFQAITQIQDQTLSQTVKIAAIVATLLAMTPFLTGPLLTATDNVFSTFPAMVR